MIKTKQELLNHFTDINAMYNNPFMYQTLSNMIDELLEQQPSEDCVSRAEAINVVHKYFTDYLKLNDDICLDGIRSLPSVTPSRPRGKWIFIRKEYRFMGGIVNEPQGCKCSNCNKVVRFKSNYCPNCGADMREVNNYDE